MSDAQDDWDGPDPTPESKGIPAPEPAAKANPDPAGLVDKPTNVESAEFSLGITANPSDDSPTIISKTIRKAVPADQAITASLRGKRLAHFELLEAIGVGGMAAVIRAHDTQLDRLVALKILPPAMSADPESLRRFQHEARAAAKLDHENIARVFYCGDDQGLHFIAFEFVEGENLRTILDRRGRIPVAEAVKYMLQIATGLAHAASRGVVHRDIKPSNIIITPTGRAKLVDMGLARSLGPQGDGALTQSGVTLGTFDYISPEQALEPRDADARSDIYSLGCTLYHMLAGQPPVPEGTAAKKLHHHQHVAPVDPRQLNPAIPDDVAAVLARMMAKDAKHRYQTPEHLVQHLLHLAHKLGGGTEIPEGVLFVDAPLPEPPRLRPLLVGGLAAAFLVSLVAILGFLPANLTTPELRPLDNIGIGPVDSPVVSKIGEKTSNGGTTKTVQPPEQQPQPAPALPRRLVAQSSKDLFEAVKSEPGKPAAVHVSLPDKVFDVRLKREEGGDVLGLVFQGKELILQAEDPLKRPVLYLGYDASGKDQPWTAFTAVSGQVTCRNLRFKIDATGTATSMTAVLRSGGRIKFENCEFIQAGFPFDAEKARMRCVEVAGLVNESKDGQPDVIFDRCYFAGGHEGLVVAAGSVQMRNCAFGPYAADIRFRGGKSEDTELRLQHCSALLGDQSSMFFLEDGATPRLVVNHCLFSNPGTVPTPGEPGAVLVRQMGDDSRLRFESESRNVYHNLSGFWVHGARMRASMLEEFRLEARTGRNDRSVALTVNPWQLDKPLAALAQAETINDAEKRQSQLAKVFQASQDVQELRGLENPDTRMIGVESCVWGNLYPATLRALKERIVDLNVKESVHGVYPSLSQAIGEAKPGDTILIKTSETIAVPPMRLEDRPEVLDLTIKPHPGFRPVLKLGQTTDMDAALFRFGDGKLTFENLEFEMPTPPAGAKAQSLVFLAGDGQCTFKKCLVTFKEPKATEVARALFTLPDPNNIMRKDAKGPSQGGPRLRLDGCFVRGEADLVAVRGSHAFSLEVEDSLLTLDGSLLVVDGSTKEPPTKPPVQITLSRITAHLNEHLVMLRACESKPMPGLVPTHIVQIANSIFSSGREKNALVHLDGMDSDEQMKRLFSWGDGKQNVYSGFMHMLEQRPRGDSVMALSQFDRTKWEEFTPREEKRRFDKVGFAGWPAADRPLSRALPSYFKIKSPLDLPAGCGVDVDRLPRPVGEMEPDPPPTPPEDD
jgi:serine/threonine protein kinase